MNMIIVATYQVSNAMLRPYNIFFIVVRALWNRHILLIPTSISKIKHWRFEIHNICIRGYSLLVRKEGLKL